MKDYRDVLKKILPLFLEAWQARLENKGSIAQKKTYKEGYWDGVSDTLRIGLGDPNKKPTLH